MPETVQYVAGITIRHSLITEQSPSTQEVYQTLLEFESSYARGALGCLVILTSNVFVSELLDPSPGYVDDGFGSRGAAPFPYDEAPGLAIKISVNGCSLSDADRHAMLLGISPAQDFAYNRFLHALAPQPRGLNMILIDWSSTIGGAECLVHCRQLLISIDDGVSDPFAPKRHDYVQRYSNFAKPVLARRNKSSYRKGVRKK